MAEMMARFTAWKDQYAAQLVDPGDRLGAGRVVTTEGITDDPYVEGTDVAGGYMIVAAADIDEATRIAQASPGVFPGASVEVREIATSWQPAQCPVSNALEIFGDRWTLLVLRDILIEERAGYGEILAANPGIATSVLADRLRRLQQRGLVAKARAAGDARQFVYRPTPLAASVVPMLLEMMVWGARQGNTTIDQTLLQRYEAARPQLIDELTARVLERSRQSD